MKLPTNWQQYGLRKNPFDTQPLVEGGDLDIEEAFVGRKSERQFLNTLFESENRICLTITGNVGVGKTSLANFHKYLWKYKKTKRIFSFRREIEASTELLSKRNFLLEIMASVIREIRLLDPQVLKSPDLKTIIQLVNITQHTNWSIGAQMAGFGGEMGKEQTSTAPPTLSITSLEEHFLNLLAFIKTNIILKTKYKGLIVHINNFDILLEDAEQKKQVIKFFNEIRDLLQTPDVYFLFLGPPHFFKDIIASQARVKGIFYQTPLAVKPLTKTEITQALSERMKLLKSKNVKIFINPISNEALSMLYELFDGDIRRIMAAIRDILGQQAHRVGTTLSKKDAQYLLAKERRDNIIHQLTLTPEQNKVLEFFIQKNSPISQKEISEQFGIKQPNVSGYYLKPLKEGGLIEEKEIHKKTTLWGLTNEYEPLRWNVRNQNKTIQTRLFN